jgi:hypothetical protein
LLKIEYLMALCRMGIDIVGHFRQGSAFGFDRIFGLAALSGFGRDGWQISNISSGGPVGGSRRIISPCLKGGAVVTDCISPFLPN